MGYWVISLLSYFEGCLPVVETGMKLVLPAFRQGRPENAAKGPELSGSR